MMDAVFLEVIIEGFGVTPIIERSQVTSSVFKTSLFLRKYKWLWIDFDCT